MQGGMAQLVSAIVIGNDSPKKHCTAAYGSDTKMRHRHDSGLRACDDYLARRTQAIDALMRSLGAFVNPIRRNPQIGVMLIILILVMAGVGLVAPILSLYAKAFATSTTLAGMVITIFGVARLLANYPAGALSQQYGRRRLLIVGLVVAAAGSLASALAPSIGWLIVCQFVQGAGSGIYMTVSTAAMADLARRDDRGNVIALQQAGMWLGAGLGPGLGGLLAQHFGLSAPFLAFGFVLAAAALIVSVYLDETADPKDLLIKGTSLTQPRVQLWSQPLFWALCVLYLATFFTRTASQSMLIPMLAVGHYGMGVDIVGLALTMLAVVTFMILPLSGNVIDRFGARNVLGFSVVTTAVALSLLALGDDPILFWTGLAVLGVGIGINGPAISVLSVEFLPPIQYGPGMGFLRSFGDAGYMLGPIFVGLLDDFGSVGVIGGLLANAVLLFVSHATFQYCYARGIATRSE
jgi:DHA1 family multidrug resistance protein-like MFS transporter